MDHIIHGNYERFPAAIVNMIISRVTSSAKLSSQVCNRVEENAFSFSLENKIGAGGFGEVFSGTYLDKKAAIKRVNESLHPDDSAFDLSSLRRELAVLSLLRAQNLLKYYGYSYKEPYYFIITELAHCSLRSFIENGRLAALDWIAKSRIAIEICRGMMVLHNAGVAHRDLKTDNILMVEEDGTLVAKIGNFGISRSVGSNQFLTRAIGTTNYMSPELLESNEVQADSKLLKADVYAFGCILWALCANEEPHVGQTHAAVQRMVDASKQKSVFGKYHTPLKIPASCPKSWRKLLIACWEYHADCRPHFRIILSHLMGESTKVR